MISKLETELREKSTAYDNIVFDFRQYQKNSDLELGSSRLEVRSKGD